MDPPSLPIIDMSNPDRQEIARKLTKAMETEGFVYLDNVPGYNKEVESELFEAAKRFFSLPIEEKLRYSPKKWNKEAKGEYRGYSPANPVDKDGVYEHFLMGETLPDDDPEKISGNPLYEATPMPSHDAAFCKIVNSHLSCMIDTGMEFMRLAAIGLGMGEHVFDDRFLPKSLSTLRFLHYPVVEEDQERELLLQAHEDLSFVTLLINFNNPGLEYLREDGSWVDIVPRPGSLVVNIGKLLSELTGGRLKATRHRVRNDSKQRDRFSLPFFFKARSDAKFANVTDSSGAQITYGTWLVRGLRKYHVYSHLPDSV